MQPISLSAHGASDVFTAEYKRASSHEVGSLLKSPLKSVSGCEYWILDRTVGTSPVDISLHFNANSSCYPGGDYLTSSNSNTSTLVVSHYDSNDSKWESLNSSTSGTFPNIIVIAENVTEFSPFTIGSNANNPLPVQLSEFNAVKTVNGALVTWTTASEINTMSFEIEMATASENNDLVEFKKVGKVVAKNAGNTVNNYQFVDYTATKKGSYFYKLKMIDFDGSFTYSPIKKVTISENSKSIAISNVYPNPFKDNLNLAFNVTETQNAVISVTDIQGQSIYSQTVKASSGLNNHEINFNSDLKHGIYFLKIQSGDINQMVKIIK